MENELNNSWDNLMYIIDNTKDKLTGDILEEEININDMIDMKHSYKRNYKEMSQNSPLGDYNSIKTKKLKYN